jgi:transposase-like protein
MVKYSIEHKFRAVAEAATKGLKPTARKFGISRNTLKQWVKTYRHYQSATPAKISAQQSAPIIARFIVDLKEADPTITLEKTKKILLNEKNVDLSIQAIHEVIASHGMAKCSYRPLQCKVSERIRNRIDIAGKMMNLGNERMAAAILNALPALSDYGILKKMPPRYLSLRRQAERLAALWNTASLQQLRYDAHQLRLVCEKRKQFLTASFVASYEMNALNFHGQPVKVISLYQRYRRYLPGLPTALKYTILMEYFSSCSYLNSPSEHLNKVFSTKLERFVERNQDRINKVEWFDALSSCFNLQENYRKLLYWTKKLLEVAPVEEKNDYQAEYLYLLTYSGNYSEILRHRDLLYKITSVPFLRASLAVSTAWLCLGEPSVALETALKAFSAAEKQNLLPAMSGFTLFLSCCYAALNEEERKQQYLRLFLHFTKGLAKYRELGRLLTNDLPLEFKSSSRMLKLAYQYRRACHTLRYADYLQVFRYAEKHGLMGFLHRIILIHPQAVMNIMRRGLKTYLPRELLNMPVFKGQQPAYRLQLLTPRENLTYGDRKIKISPGSKDFHLLVFLLLHRNRVLHRDQVTETFFRNAQNPTLCLTKALSRIRSVLLLPKGSLKTSNEQLIFRTDISVDLEDFEKRYWTGKTLEKAGETSFALKEYRECLNVYHTAPFSKMGYHYNFAEEKRTTARRMLEEVATYLMGEAKKISDWKAVRNIADKLKKEELLHPVSLA